MRIGHGYDVHKFAPGDGLVLGGVFIPYSQTLEAHSDGDVVIHALIDSILGALGEGDIGQHFPDTDPQYSGCDSRQLLELIVKIMVGRQYQLGNVDITIIAQAPKMAPHLSVMRENLAATLRCAVDQVNLKATTTEGLGFTGRGEGISCHAVTLLVPQED
jgi:2-C-methyl-D-erythritol 2,4-cyclodiphosphate synthase